MDSHTAILTINAGSATLKFAVFTSGPTPARLVSGIIDRVGHPDAVLRAKQPTAAQYQEAVVAADHVGCLTFLTKWLATTAKIPRIHAIGHRIVHGGQRYIEAQIVTPELIGELRRLREFAPEHLPAEIDLLTGFEGAYPNVPQIACFDTAFHRDLPRVAKLLPIPRRYESAGVRRYGFHGLSYEYLMEELARLGDPAVVNGRIVLAHLGNGASMAAVRNGRCLDTTMAFTPTAGLVMSRRSGDLDPGIAAYLARTEGMTVAQFYEMVNQQSGLLGISEISSDMRELLAVESNDERAADAIAVFCYQARKWVGAFTAALGGLDTVVFSGGIGENSAAIRARVCAGLEYLGVALDEERNAKNAPLISLPTSRVAVRVLPTDEEAMIARSVCRVLEFDS